MKNSEITVQLKSPTGNTLTRSVRKIKSARFGVLFALETKAINEPWNSKAWKNLEAMRKDFTNGLGNYTLVAISR
jgi:hypothetical protein